MFTYFSVGFVNTVSSIPEISQKVVDVFSELLGAVVNSATQHPCGGLLVLLPSKIKTRHTIKKKRKRKKTLISASALSRIYGRLSKVSRKKH